MQIGGAQPDGGVEWIADAYGCAAERLATPAVVRQIMDRIIGELDLHVVDQLWHQFPAPGGVTGLYLLRESHLGCHTYPESGLATFNLYCCRQRPEWPWQARLADLLGARDVKVVRVPRGQISEQWPR